LAISFANKELTLDHIGVCANGYDFFENYPGCSDPCLAKTSFFALGGLCAASMQTSFTALDIFASIVAQTYSLVKPLVPPDI
jgi:hypothetical protein